MSLWGLEGNLLNARPFLGCEAVDFCFPRYLHLHTSVVLHQHCINVSVLLYNNNVSIASIAPFISYHIQIGISLHFLPSHHSRKVLRRRASLKVPMMWRPSCPPRRHQAQSSPSNEKMPFQKCPLGAMCLGVVGGCSVVRMLKL